MLFSPDNPDFSDELNDKNDKNEKDDLLNSFKNIFKEKMTYREAVAIDKYLFDLSFYDICKGMMIPIKSPEEYMDLHIRAIERFNYYKKMIKLGEFTLDELSEMIVYNNAAMPKSGMYVNFNSDESVKRMIGLFEENVLYRETVKNSFEKLGDMKFLQDFLKNFGKINKDDKKRNKPEDETTESK